MANVTQCDVCANVVKHEQSKYVEVYNVTAGNSTGAKIHRLELCMDCYKKLCKALGLEAKQ